MIIGGAFLVGIVQTLVLAIIFVIITFITVSGIYMDKIAPKISKRIRPNFWSIFLGTLCLNIITGMRGRSGGSLFSPF